MAELRYGSALTVGLSDQNAKALRELTIAIIRAGDTQWLPLQTTIDGKPAVADVLVGPGLPIFFTSGDVEGADAHLEALFDEYLPADDVTADEDVSED